MKIAIIGNPYDPSDPKRKESVAYYIANTFERLGAEVVRIVPPRVWTDFVPKSKYLFYAVMGKKILYEREKSLMKKIGELISIQLEKVEPDFVFSFGSMPHSYVDSKYPFAFWSDATFEALMDYHPGYKKILKYQRKLMHLKEEETINKANFVCYASEWAASSAINYYKADKDKVKIIPLGANLNILPSDSEIKEMINNKKGQKLNIVWIGVDWDMKGGKKLIETALSLKIKGIDFEINCIGAKGIIPAELNNNFNFHGFLNKSIAKHRSFFYEIMSKAHFHFLMTRSEAFGHAYCEANAFGIPNVASNTGGVPSAVKDGVSGHLFDMDENSMILADHMINLYMDYSRYTDLCLSSRKEYDDNLNWDVGVKKIMKLIEQNIKLISPEK